MSETAQQEEKTRDAAAVYSAIFEQYDRKVQAVARNAFSPEDGDWLKRPAQRFNTSVQAADASQEVWQEVGEAIRDGDITPDHIMLIHRDRKGKITTVTVGDVADDALNRWITTLAKRVTDRYKYRVRWDEKRTEPAMVSTNEWSSSSKPMEESPKLTMLAVSKSRPMHGLELVVTALWLLTRAQRRAVGLYYLRGRRTIADVAKSEGISADSIKDRLSLAMKNLRKYFANTPLLASCAFPFIVWGLKFGPIYPGFGEGWLIRTQALNALRDERRAFFDALVIESRWAVEPPPLAAALGGWTKDFLKQSPLSLPEMYIQSARWAKAVEREWRGVPLPGDEDLENPFVGWRHPMPVDISPPLWAVPWENLSVVQKYYLLRFYRSQARGRIRRPTIEGNLPAVTHLSERI